MFDLNLAFSRKFLLWLQRLGLQLESIIYHPLMNTIDVLHSNIYHFEFSNTYADENAYSALEHFNFERLKSLSILGPMSAFSELIAIIFKSPLPFFEHLRLCCRFVTTETLECVLNSAYAMKKLFLQPLSDSFVDLNSLSPYFHDLHFLFINNISNTIQLDDSALMAIANQCPDLTTLILINCQGTSHISVQYLLDHTPLETLGINNESHLCDWNMPQMDEIRISESLQSLSLHYCDSITSRFLDQVLMKGTSLHTLKLYCCSSIENYCSVFQFTALCSLHLHCCPNLNDDSFSIFTPENHSLLHLKLSYCDSLTDIGFLYIMNRFPSLKSATLKECRNITSMSILQITLICKELKKLHLCCMKVPDLHHLHPHNSNFLLIQHLKIFNCAHISYSDLSRLIKKLRLLRSLKIRRSSDSFRRHDFLKCLAEECPYLQHFLLHDEHSKLLPREVMFIIGNLENLVSLSILMKEFVSEEKLHEAKLKYKSLNPVLDLDMHFF